MNDKPNHQQRAYHAWNELVLAAKERRLLRYREIGDVIGVHSMAMKFALEPIQAHCIRQQLPPLSILVVNAKGRPGPGFTAWDSERFDEGCERVFDWSWDNEENPFAYAADGAHIEDFVVELTSGASPEDVYVRVKSRAPAQRIFRCLMLEAYRSRCAVCLFPVVDVLDAAHIKPWSACHCGERLDPANGLLLCRNHHALFDAGFIAVGVGDRLCVNRGKIKSSAIDELDGLQLQQPVAVWAGERRNQYLRWHRKHVAKLV